MATTNKLFARLFSWSPTKVSLLLSLVMVCLYALDPHFLRLIELKSLDTKFWAFGPKPPGDEVVIVAVDEKSLDALGHWPWPRSTLAHLVESLSQNDARVVGFDMVFPEPDDGGELRNLLDLEANLGKLGLNNADLSRWLADSKGRADHDGQFAEAIRLKSDLAGAHQHLGLVYAI